MLSERASTTMSAQLPLNAKGGNLPLKKGAVISRGRWQVAISGRLWNLNETCRPPFCLEKKTKQNKTKKQNKTNKTNKTNCVLLMVGGGVCVWCV
jgi:hypothetical protein